MERFVNPCFPFVFKHALSFFVRCHMLICFYFRGRRHRRKLLFLFHCYNVIVVCYNLISIYFFYVVAAKRCGNIYERIEKLTH